MSEKTGTAQIGVIGMAVMGSNLARNFANHGYRTAIYNRTFARTEQVLAQHPQAGFVASQSLEDFVDSLERPRRMVIMVKAGAGTDAVIDALIPLLEPGDIVVDGGNAFFQDTRRREQRLREHDLHFVGAGISGGETGALEGPSIMPGGSQHAYAHIGAMLEEISAKVGPQAEPCCTYIGTDGAGHFVKMVHNGIEYGDMQLIADAYAVLSQIAGRSNEEMATIFAGWGAGKLSSYLIEITSEILRHREPSGDYLIDKILDAAGQKGTGKWSVINSLEYGEPLGLIATAVYERSLSSGVDLRREASELYPREARQQSDFTEADVLALERTLYASKIVSYAQGFSLLSEASRANGWGLDLASIARIWRNGCIIRSSFLNDIAAAYQAEPELKNLLLAPYFHREVEEARRDWRQTVANAFLQECSVPAFASALSYFSSLTTRRLPANLVQAQRDFFGAHTFERVDQPRGQFFHENWTGRGSDTSSTSYNA